MLSLSTFSFDIIEAAVADAGFPKGGQQNQQAPYLSYFAEKCMKMKNAKKKKKKKKIG